MAFFKRKDMLSIFQRKHETYLFQLVMDEIANTWGEMVRLRRLELPRVLSHSDLNAARLPVPPQPHLQ